MSSIVATGWSVMMVMLLVTFSSSGRDGVWLGRWGSIGHAEASAGHLGVSSGGLGGAVVIFGAGLRVE